MSNIDTIETEAASVEEATRTALEQLGARDDEVTIEVLATARAGVLGLGARSARVRVTRKDATGSGDKDATRAGDPGAPASRRGASSGGNPDDGGARKSADAEEQRREATEILKQILEQMGERAEVRQIEIDAESVELEIKGDGSGILIGRHGQTLDALEYIVNRILARRIKDAAPISLETESYRLRRRQQLHRMALSVGERAKREHQAVRLDPMPPRDRRAVHMALKDDPMITTRSVGEGFMRSIEVAPSDGGGRRERGNAPGQSQQGQAQAQGQGQQKGSGQGQGQGRGRRRDRERGPERERPTERKDEAIGEQGGFKHGQKRIV